MWSRRNRDFSDKQIRIDNHSRGTGTLISIKYLVTIATAMRLIRVFSHFDHKEKTHESDKHNFHK